MGTPTIGGIVAAIVGFTLIVAIIGIIYRRYRGQADQSRQAGVTTLMPISAGTLNGGGPGGGAPQYAYMQQQQPPYGGMQPQYSYVQPQYVMQPPYGGMQPQYGQPQIAMVPYPDADTQPGVGALVPMQVVQISAPGPGYSMVQSAAAAEPAMGVPYVPPPIGGGMSPAGPPGAVAAGPTSGASSENEEVPLRTVEVSAPPSGSSNEEAGPSDVNIDIVINQAAHSKLTKSVD